MGAAPADELLRRAGAARAAGDGEAARAAYLAAFEQAKAVADVETMSAAALGLAAGLTFGAHPGRVPAFLHDAYLLARDDRRTRLAVALARVWVYGGDPARAVPFAAEAVATAEPANDPALLADALDAELLVHWGPDQLSERVRITARLEDVVAHLSDVEARLSTYLWRLTTGLESLDMVTVRRQLRALNALAEESASPRVRFFAASRQGMHALLRGDLLAAAELRDRAVEYGTAAGEPDTLAIDHSLSAGLARQTGDSAALALQAESYEQFGIAEGVLSVAAEGATLWLAAGQPDRARALLDQLTGDGFETVARDLDWLFIVGALTETAAGVGAGDLAQAGAELLTPYAGRGVLTAGAVAFVAVVDDYLRMACASLGRTDEARQWTDSAARCYQRIGATWWLQRLALPRSRPGVAHFAASSTGVWNVGRDGHLTALRDMKGLQYLRILLQRPGVEIAAADLSAAAGGHAGSGIEQHDLGPVLDRRALAEYRRRIAELDAELDESAGWHDDGRTERLHAERDALLAEIGAATGLHGRPRSTGATAERARIAVRKAIAAAVERIGEHDPALARLLRDTVHTGATCCYEPDPDRPMRWLL